MDHPENLILTIDNDGASYRQRLKIGEDLARTGGGGQPASGRGSGGAGNTGRSVNAENSSNCEGTTDANTGTSRKLQGSAC